MGKKSVCIAMLPRSALARARQTAPQCSQAVILAESMLYLHVIHGHLRPSQTMVVLGDAHASKLRQSPPKKHRRNHPCTRDDGPKKAQLHPLRYSPGHLLDHPTASPFQKISVRCHVPFIHSPSPKEKENPQPQFQNSPARASSMTIKQNPSSTHDSTPRASQGSQSAFSHTQSAHHSSRTRPSSPSRPCTDTPPPSCPGRT
jgi:hypothetical protein